MLRFNIIISYTRAIQREEKYKRYKCGNSNIQEFPTSKVYQQQGSNSQRRPTLSQNPPISLISPLLRPGNLQEVLQCGICLPQSSCNYQHRTAVAVPKRHTVHPHPSNLNNYHLHPSIISETDIFRDLMDFVKNSSLLRTCASRNNVHSRNIKILLD